MSLHLLISIMGNHDVTQLLQYNVILFSCLYTSFNHFWQAIASIHFAMVAMQEI